MIVSGGTRTAERARRAAELSSADAVMIARGALGYPWVFEELLGARSRPPSRGEVLGELLWVLERGAEHWGADRAARNLRRFYPWYLERLGIRGRRAAGYQRAASLDEVRALLAQEVGSPARPTPIAVSLGGRGATKIRHSGAGAGRAQTRPAEASL